MKKHLLLSLKIFLILLMLPVTSNAEQKKISKIAVVDFAKITNDTKAYKTLAKSAESKKNSIEEELKKVDSELLKSKKLLLAKKDKIKKKDYDGLVEEYNKNYLKKVSAFNARKAKIKSSYNEAVAYINNDIKKIVAKISKKNNFDIVIQKGLLTFSKKNLDITDQVISELDKKIKKMNIDG